MRPSAHPEEGTGYVYTSSMENKGPETLRSPRRGLCSLQYFPGNTSFCQWFTGTSRGEHVLAILAALLVHDRNTNQHTDSHSNENKYADTNPYYYHHGDSRDSDRDTQANQHADGNSHAAAATYPSCSIYFVYDESYQDCSN